MDVNRMAQGIKPEAKVGKTIDGTELFVVATKAGNAAGAKG